MGVVTASTVHEKNPAQHSADLQMLEKMDDWSFGFKDLNGESKRIECVRVDGATDEGPGYHEVQFMWTERHFKRPTLTTLVTTRCSGDSFLNRVELQNGCLSRSHSNLFIPSSLTSEPADDNGDFSETKHKDNMREALKQYITRVDETPGMKTVIKLYFAEECHAYAQRR